MVYECYTQDGTLVAAFDIEVKNLETIIIEYGDNYYRPITYDLRNNIAKCVPVSIIRKNGNDLVAGTKGVLA